MTDTAKWALILGGSSGLGLATAEKLARHGYGILIVHRDRKTDMEQIDESFRLIAESAKGFFSFNSDALNVEKRTAVLEKIKDQIGSGKIKVLVHSIAKGNLKPMSDSESEVLTNQDFHLTLDAMAISLYDWVKAIAEKEMFAEDARVIAYTSEGNAKAWKGYAAVSAAKVALEAIVRNIALEFAGLGIKANCIQAGITDTKSFRRIPHSDALKKDALKKNPNNRLTAPQDVADATYLLTLEEAKWITGTVIKVDGGESLN